MAEKPKASSSFAQTELDKAEKQFEAFDQNVKDLVEARDFKPSGQPEEQQTKLSQSEIAKSTRVELKPKKTIGCKEKFNDKFTEAWNYAKEMVHFVAENKEIIGETLDLWTRPFPGIPAQEWEVPVNKPIWCPRYLYEQIARKYYHRLVMQDKTITAADGMGAYYGSMAMDTTIQRLEAHLVVENRRVSMGRGPTNFR